MQYSPWAINILPYTRVNHNTDIIILCFTYLNGCIQEELNLNIKMLELRSKRCPSAKFVSSSSSRNS